MSSTVDEAVAPPNGAGAAVVERLRARLGDAVVAHHIRPGDDPWVRIRTDAWSDTAAVLRRDLGFHYFCFLSAIDWLPSPFGKSEDDPTEPPPERPTEIVQGYTGGDTRFQVLARVADPVQHVGVVLKTDVPDDTMTVGTWTATYAGADWHERETWEMFGITFAGHPSLRHIYLPSEFEGHPLRKDVPLLARLVKPWPGIVDVEPIPPEFAGDAEAES